MSKKLTETPMMPPGETNAYEVLKFVSKVIHKTSRLNMGSFVAAFKGKRRYVTREQPSCGTVACVAGWVTIVVTGKEYASEYTAMEALGLQRSDWGGGHSPVYNALYRFFFAVEIPKKHVHKNLNALMREHREELEASSVVVTQ